MRMRMRKWGNCRDGKRGTKKSNFGFDICLFKSLDECSPRKKIESSAFWKTHSGSGPNLRHPTRPETGQAELGDPTSIISAS